MLNLDSSPNPDLMMIGSGILSVNPYDPTTGLPTAYFDVGNCSGIEPTNSDVRFQKYESRTRNRALYDDLLLRRNTDIKITLDEWNRINLKLWLQGVTGQTAAQAATPVTAEVLTASAVLGATYQTAKYGPISAVAVKQGATTFTVGTDYTVDLVTGHITFLSSGTIVAGVSTTVDYTPTAYASGITTLPIGTVNKVLAALRFVGDPANGPRIQIDWWRVNTKPDGALKVITTGNENDPISITATVETDPVNHPNSPIGLVTFLPA